MSLPNTRTILKTTIYCQYMPTETLHIDNSTVDNAVTLWRSGGLVAMPTETVYGLGADATNGRAVASIYSVKSRPQFNPLIVHVADVATAKRYVEWNDAAQSLADAFWPGPMTLVLKRRADSSISELVSAGGDTIGIRIPSHPVALQLLKAFDGGIAAPSANRSGKVSPTTAQHVEEEFGGDVKLIIDGGACSVGLESTVLDVSGNAVRLLRPGSVTRDQVEAVTKTVVLSGTDTGQLKSPGQLAAHYAPSIPVKLNITKLEEGDALLAFGLNAPLGAETTLNLSPTGDLVEAAANLFSYLRALDNGYHRAIAVMSIPDIGIGEAINDRLKRSAVR